MKSAALKALTATLLLATTPVLQAGDAASAGSSGTSGSSGSGGFGIDTFASNTPGASMEKDGGLANAIDKAMSSNNADCGKLKCD